MISTFLNIPQCLKLKVSGELWSNSVCHKSLHFVIRSKEIQNANINMFTECDINVNNNFKTGHRRNKNEYFRE